MAKTNLNSDNDTALRRGQSEVYKSQKSQRVVRDVLKSKENKEQLMDFIFGNWY